MKIQTLVLGAVRTNCYLITNEETRETIIIDPGAQAELVKAKIQELGSVPMAVLLTHGHFDHIMAAKELAEEYAIEIYVHETEKELVSNSSLNGGYLINTSYGLVPDTLIKEEVLKMAGFELQVLHTPGHTVGSVCFYLKDQKVLISGDTLFLGSVGRTDLPTGNFDTLQKSIREKLFILPEDVIVYPGHGDATTIGYEKNHNPYVS
ncbi:MBL fold metallo-hydrolase [Anaerocolumna cellulosilytica]|uniref:MBL fold metallo-hydrolase n=1 Tax=Anaerocolumna cellulosilytica TaxID=433286 RepID=A0A6S6QUW7_9FIRM|nr:MBL fold metallo-hydrolase [Anaerocolumna cellulosilytica]MBB5194542.1 glyoxylase-like metal-dependent hydrolase (beta-lactamase superfamily II) [Anaerocolumna cellulosilytica]BCJ93486.1 MBL fold metallo-hydrolase [Anaerocolumna cellulosilytica]